MMVINMRLNKGYLRDKIKVPQNSVPEEAKVMNGDTVVREFSDITKHRLVNEIYTMANGYVCDFDRIIVRQGRFISTTEMPWRDSYEQ